MDTCRHVGAQRSGFFVWRRFILLSLSISLHAMEKAILSLSVAP